MSCLQKDSGGVVPERKTDGCQNKRLGKQKSESKISRGAVIQVVCDFGVFECFAYSERR